MDYPWAEQFGRSRATRIALSVHAPIAGFMGHAERAEARNGGRDARPLGRHRKGRRCRAGRLPSRLSPRADAQARDRLGRRAARGLPRSAREEGTRRPVRGRDHGPRPRAREPEDVFPISSRCAGFARCSTSRTCTRSPTAVSRRRRRSTTSSPAANRVLPRGAPFHIHFSDIAYANRNETKHLPYGEGTLRAEPLGKALRKFERPATVISESPGVESSQAIKEELYAAAGKSAASRSSSSLGLVVAAARRARTPRRAEDVELDLAAVGAREMLESRPEELFGLVVAILCRPHLASDAGRRAGGRRRRADGLARVERELLCLVDPPALEQELREQPLALTERRPITDRLDSRIDSRNCFSAFSTSPCPTRPTRAMFSDARHGPDGAGLGEQLVRLREPIPRPPRDRPGGGRSSPLRTRPRR